MAIQLAMSSWSGNDKQRFFDTNSKKNTCIRIRDMEPGIQHLEIASGLKEVVIESWVNCAVHRIEGSRCRIRCIRDRGIRSKDSLQRSQKDCG